MPAGGSGAITAPANLLRSLNSLFSFFPKRSHDSPVVLRLDFETIHQVVVSHLFPIYLFCHLGQSGVVLTRVPFVKPESLV